MSANLNKPLLTIEDLTIEFHTDAGSVTAVKKMDLTLKKGQTLGIVGESGSGKSVTSLATMGLLPSDISEVPNGHIWFESEKYGKVDLLTLGIDEMRSLRGNELAMIFQEPMTSLNPVFTCGEQVAEALKLHKGLDKNEAKSVVIDLFEQVELPRPEKMYSSYPHEISGGQKQRVMIAMAMSCSPALLIADEPTTALDVTVQKQILHLMKKMRDEKDTSIIFITHDLGVIAEIADTVLVMYRGDVVEYGSVLDIFENPKHPYTKGLLACRPKMDTTIKVLPTVSDFMEVDSEGQIVERTVNVSTEQRSEKQVVEGQLPQLSIKNLSTHFPTKRSIWGKPLEYVKAVNEVSFDVYEGETIGLVGESGCGKTTLGRSILRLVESTSGEVFYEGEDVLKSSKAEMKALRKSLQIIFQDPYSSLNPKMTIGEAIMEPMNVNKVLENKKVRKDKAYELLEKVGLSRAHFQRYPHEFSGGQRQRISIARTLALQPKVVICDESVSALDVSVQAQVLNLLNDLKEEFKFTYIFISHDLSVVKFMADRLIVMKDGEIEEAGSAESIYRNPASDYTKQLIAAIPEGNLDEIKALQEQRKMYI